MGVDGICCVQWGVAADHTDAGTVCEGGGFSALGSSSFPDVAPSARLLLLLLLCFVTDPGVSSPPQPVRMAAVRTLRKLCQHSQHPVCKLHTSVWRWVRTAALKSGEIKTAIGALCSESRGQVCISWNVSLFYCSPLLSTCWKGRAL